MACKSCSFEGCSIFVGEPFLPTHWILFLVENFSYLLSLNKSASIGISTWRYFLADFIGQTVDISEGELSLSPQLQLGIFIRRFVFESLLLRYYFQGKMINSIVY